MKEIMMINVKVAGYPAFARFEVFKPQRPLADFHFGLRKVIVFNSNAFCFPLIQLRILAPCQCRSKHLKKKKVQYNTNYEKSSTWKHNTTQYIIIQLSKTPEFQKVWGILKRYNSTSALPNFSLDQKAFLSLFTAFKSQSWRTQLCWFITPFSTVVMHF